VVTETYPESEEAKAMDNRLVELHEMMAQAMEQVKRLGEAARTVGEPAASAAMAERQIFGRLLAMGRVLMAEYVASVGPGDEALPVRRDDQWYTRRVERSVQLLTVFGVVDVPRFVYYGRDGARYAPSEAKLSLPDRQASYFVQQLLGRLALEETFDQGVRFFGELFGVDVSTHTVDEIVREQATEQAAFNAQARLPTPPAADAVQVVSLDGKGVPVIKHGAGRCPPRLAKGEKRQQKQEALVGVSYTVKRHERDARSLALSLVMPELLSDEQRERLRRGERARDIHYEASLTDKPGVPAALRERLIRQILGGPPPDTVCLIDGSPRLAALAAEYFPGVPVVLDIIHVCEYLWQAAHVLHAERSREAKRLVTVMLTTLLEGRVGHVIGGLKQRRHQLAAKGRRRTLDKVIGYLHNHRDHMHYDVYLARGYPIGTGVVESACGHLVKNRMEKAGARWSREGAEAMLRLRAIYASGDWKAYLPYREQAEHHRLYSRAA
jgi:hypothetical protein